jgi:hypothetical protein
MGRLRIYVALLLFPTVVLGAAPSFRYVDGRLTGRVDGADLADVLAELGRQAGLEIRGLAPEPQPISVELDGVPLANALPRLLPGRSFLLTYDGTRPARVIVLAESRATMASVPEPSRALPRPATSDPPRAAINASDDVPIRGRLARALGLSRAGFSQLMGAAVASRDARVRLDALRLALRVLNAEPERYMSALDMLAGMGDANLAAWLTRVAGNSAPRIVRRTARTAQAGPLRLRAVAMDRFFRTHSS